MGDNLNNDSSIQKNEADLLFYKDLMASFFAKNHPDINLDEFWNWFLSDISEKKLDINSLSPEDLNQFLLKLSDIGDKLFPEFPK